MMLGELIGYASNFFLGFCMMLGAAFAFQRSKRAALFIAIGGLCYVLAAPVEYFVAHMGMQMHMDRTTVQFFFMLVSIGRHVALFGGLAMGMREIARVPA